MGHPNTIIITPAMIQKKHKLTTKYNTALLNHVIARRSKAFTHDLLQAKEALTRMGFLEPQINTAFSQRGDERDLAALIKHVPTLQAALPYITPDHIAQAVQHKHYSQAEMLAFLIKNLEFLKAYPKDALVSIFEGVNIYITLQKALKKPVPVVAEPVAPVVIPAAAPVVVVPPVVEDIDESDNESDNESSYDNDIDNMSIYSDSSQSEQSEEDEELEEQEELEEDEEIEENLEEDEVLEEHEDNDSEDNDSKENAHFEEQHIDIHEAINLANDFTEHKGNNYSVYKSDRNSNSGRPLFFQYKPELNDTAIDNFVASLFRKY